jgi:tetratricopeptide (TPR) repeat protein
LKTTTLKKSPGVVDDKIRWSKPESEIDEFVGVGARNLLRLGDGLRKIGDNKGALYQYDKALKIEPFNPVILLRSAKTLFFSKKYDESESRLKLCIEKNPNYVSAYEIFGEQYFNLGNEYNSKRKEYLHRGDGYKDKSEDDKAKEMYDKAKEMHDKAKEMYNKAIPMFREAIFINPFNPHVHESLGMAYLNLEQYGLAYQELSITRIFNPGDIVVGTILLRLKAMKERSSQ